MTALGPGMYVTPNIRLAREIGGGGMGRVWLADHLALRCSVVVKFVSPEYAANEEALQRFSREAAAAAQVKSPHVVQTLDHGVTADGLPYIVMEHLEGRDLRAALEQCARLTPQDAASIVGQIAKALGRAHKRGIIHRDIKPENIFLCDHGEEMFVKLVDFGIARGVEAGGLATASGMVIGTAPYMSPEQLMAKPLDARTDLWSLGVVAFEVLTGALPFPGDTIAAVTLSIFQAPRRKPSEAYPALGPAFDAWFERACATDPDDRFASAAELADAFVAAANVPARAQIGSGSAPRTLADVDAVTAKLPTPGVTAGPVSASTFGAQLRPRRALWIGGAFVAISTVALALLLARGGETPPIAGPAAAPSAVASAAEPLPVPSTVVTFAPSAASSASIAPSAPTAKPSVKPLTKPVAPKKPGKHDASIY
ncbi:MAG: serine/threonine protein kinase [Deltaproteobacteria bacterium]|nr:serine/threonine protein kinase [Deltaproteobacteria bacterium]